MAASALAAPASALLFSVEKWEWFWYVNECCLGGGVSYAASCVDLILVCLYSSAVVCLDWRES